MVDTPGTTESANAITPAADPSAAAAPLAAGASSVAPPEGHEPTAAQSMATPPARPAPPAPVAAAADSPAAPVAAMPDPPPASPPTEVPAPPSVAAAPDPASAGAAPASQLAPPPVAAALDPAPAAANRRAPARSRGEILLVAWGDAPAGAWAEDLARDGYSVHVERGGRIAAFQWARDRQPVAIVIDLSVQPEAGRAIASTLRVTPDTAHIPLVFCYMRETEAAGPRTSEEIVARLATLIDDEGEASAL